ADAADPVGCASPLSRPRGTVRYSSSPSSPEASRAPSPGPRSPSDDSPNVSNGSTVSVAGSPGAAGSARSPQTSWTAPTNASARNRGSRYAEATDGARRTASGTATGTEETIAATSGRPVGAAAGWRT